MYSVTYFLVINRMHSVFIDCTDLYRIGYKDEGVSRLVCWSTKCTSFVIFAITAEEPGPGGSSEGGSTDNCIVKN